MMIQFIKYISFYTVIYFYSFILSSDVIDLTPDNFDTIINGDAHALVEFYAPWCGHCKNLAPIYEQIGTSFKKISNVIIAKINADDHKSLASKYGITGFPTLKYFPKGSTKAEDYTGGREPSDFVEFLNQKAQSNVKIITPSSDVLSLSEADFDSIVMNPNVHALVEFYAPWCGHCKQLAPIYEKLGTIYAGEENVIIAKVDATKHAGLASIFGVTGYPTIKYFDNTENKQPKDYSGGRDLDSFIQFINKNAKTHRTAEGRLDSEAGRLKEIDTILDKTKEINKDVLQQIEKVVKNYKKDSISKIHGNLYVKAIKKVLEKGKNYIKKETERLENLIQSENVTPKKKTLFQLRQNILKIIGNVYNDVSTEESALTEDEDHEKSQDEL